MSGIVVLISGKGSNLAAMCNAGLTSYIKCVISNKANAPGLEFAKSVGLNVTIIPHNKFASRESFDQDIAEIIDHYNPELIVLAGFMRILSPWFINHYHNKIINIHPSLLPSFIGATAQTDTLAARVKVSGATVHFVTDKLDHGPIIAQGVVPVNITDDIESIKKRILALEHTIYPFVIHKILNGQVKLDSMVGVIINKDHTDNQWLKEFTNHIFY
jgi:phosphoribosylglycinamide formyltransferase 1